MRQPCSYQSLQGCNVCYWIWVCYILELLESSSRKEGEKGENLTQYCYQSLFGSLSTLTFFIWLFFNVLYLTHSIIWITTKSPPTLLCHPPQRPLWQLEESYLGKKIWLVRLMRGSCLELFICLLSWGVSGCWWRFNITLKQCSHLTPPPCSTSVFIKSPLET